MEENSIFRKKNHYLADFTTGIRRIQVKSVQEGGAEPRLAAVNRRFAAAYLRRGLQAVGQATEGVAVAGERSFPVHQAVKNTF